MGSEDFRYIPSMFMPPSLFEPKSQSALLASKKQLTEVLSQDLALLCGALAVGLLGFAMFVGRLYVRRSLRVATGCFVLLDAPAIEATVFSLLHHSEPRPIGVAANRCPKTLHVSASRRRHGTLTPEFPRAPTSLRRGITHSPGLKFFCSVWSDSFEVLPAGM